MRKRLLIIAISTFFLFSLLIVQYFRIQILEGDQWTKTACSQHECILVEAAKRGGFYSNSSLKKGHPEKPQELVFDITKFHLYIDPLAIKSQYKAEIAQNLCTLLAIHSEEEKIQKTAEFNKKSHSRKFAMWLDKDKKSAIEKWWKPYAKKRKIPYNALYYIRDYQRCYPFGKLLGVVLHTIRELKDENTHEGIPTGGLESFFNDQLKGKNGKRKLLRSPFNSLEIDKVIEKPENGKDIFLTINHYIQAIAEEELEKGVKRAKAKGGWVAMMDPYSGEMLAFAQYPFFDPTSYKEFFNDKDKIEYAKAKALTDAFEVGSIMKPITVALALKASEELVEKGKPPLFSAEEKIDCSRSQFPGRGNKPLKDKILHRYLNMDMAIQKSSNVYMAQVVDRIVNKMGNQWYRNALVNTFGFGKKTGIELPSEATGLVPTPGKLHPNGALEWSLPTPYSLAMGHNILATTLQMLRAYAVFANGGCLVEPTLIKKITQTSCSGNVEVCYDNSAIKSAYPKVLSETICRQVLAAMKYTTKPGGTAIHASISGYTEAGKTGTAEKIVDGSYCAKRHLSSFIGYAPANLNSDPSTRFVLIVTIDDPEYQILEGGIKSYMGGWCAAPVFREIARRTLEYLGIEPDDPYGYPAQDPRFDAEKSDWIKEVKELKLLYDTWNNTPKEK